MMGFVAGLLIAATSSLGLAAESDTVEDSVRDVLSDSDFAFCHDPKYPLTREEAGWCPLLEGSEQLCPAYRDACDAPRAVIVGGSGPLGRRQAGEGESHEEMGERSGPARQSEATEAREPSPMASWVATMLLWVVVGAMAIGVAMALFGQSRSGRRRDELEPTAGEGAMQSEAEAPSPRAPVETDVQRLLERAQARANVGDYDAAVADTHAAMLRHLEAQGRIHVHTSRTNGDYVAELRDDPALVRPVREVVTAVERVQFGHATTDRTVFDRVSRAVHALVRATSLSVLLLVLGTATWACDPQAREYPWATSPSGYRATLELLDSRGFDVGYRHEPLSKLDAESPTLIVLQDAQLDEAQWQSLMSWVRAGGQAVLTTTEGLQADIGVWQVDTERGPRMRLFGPPWFGDLDVAVSGHAGLGFDPERGASPLLVADNGVAYAVAIEGPDSAIGQGRLVVLADERLLHNGSLPVADNATFLVGLLGDLDARVRLVDVWLTGDGSGTGSDNPFEAIERANLTPLIVQLLLLLLLLYAWRGVHFGRPRDPPPASRRSFSEHARAVAQQYARADATRHALRLYSTWALDRLQERLAHGQAGLYALAQRVAARTGRDETEVMRVLVEAHGAREGEAGPAAGASDAAADLELMRELGELIEATGAKR